jgi:hypothetical protein
LNADSSIRSGLDRDSNVTQINDLHYEKKDAPSTSMGDGIRIACNPLPWKWTLQFAPTSTVTQMELISATCSHESKISQAFQPMRE